MNREILRLQSITQRLYGNKVLSNIYFNLYEGEIHGIIGINGAGKSTLARVIAGWQQGYEGTIFLENQKVRLASAEMAMHMGIAMVPQDPDTISTMSIAEYIFTLRKEASKRVLLRRREMEGRTIKLLEEMGYPLPPGRTMGELTRSQKKFMSIAKTLTYNPKILIFDDTEIGMEPEDVNLFWGIIKKQCLKGISCIVISQNLPRLSAECGRITVLRGGRIAGTVKNGSCSEAHIMNLVLGTKDREGDKISEIHLGREILRLEDIRGIYLKKVSFSIAQGEILGLTGADDAGKEELGDILYGCKKYQSGSLYFCGQPVTVKASHEAVRMGIGFIPEERNRLLLENQTVKDNLTFLQMQTAKNRFGYLKPSIAGYLARDWCEKENISEFAKNTLNEVGGNVRQKLLLGRWQDKTLKLLLLNHPTNGLEQKERRKTLERILEYSKNGTAVLLITNDLQELVSLCHRVIVLKKGEISGEIYKEELSEMAVTKLKLM